ncbi:MAG: FHA domain-containing protein [Polyangiales bacterium]
MADPQNRSPRTFQCREYIWDAFDQLSQELDCSIDSLLNEALRHYVLQRGRGLPYAEMAEQPEPRAQQGYRPQPPMPPMGRPGMPTGMAPGAPASMRPPGPPMNRPGMPGMPGMPQGGPRLPPMGGGLPPAPMNRPPMPGMPGMPQGSMPMMGRPGMPAPPGPPQPRMGPPQGMHGAPRPPSNAGRTLIAIYEGQQYPVTKAEFIIGRGQKTSDLTIRDSNVSRRHACVVEYNGQFWIVDQQSTNGVEFNGAKVERKVIEDGDLYRICDHEIQFVYR